MYFRDENNFGQSKLIYWTASNELFPSDAVVSGRRENAAFRFPHVYLRSLEAGAPHDEIWLAFPLLIRSRLVQQSANANLIILNGFCAQKPINCTSSLCMSAFSLRFCALLCLANNEWLDKENAGLEVEKKWKSKRQQSAERESTWLLLSLAISQQKIHSSSYTTPRLAFSNAAEPLPIAEKAKEESWATSDASAQRLSSVSQDALSPCELSIFRESRSVWQAKTGFALLAGGLLTRWFNRQTLWITPGEKEKKSRSIASPSVIAAIFRRFSSFSDALLVNFVFIMARGQLTRFNFARGANKTSSITF
jgi:hypothetical protein